MKESCATDRIARILRDSRTESGMLQKDVAKLMGISRRTVQNWEEGTAQPPLLKLRQWFKVLNVHPIPYIIQMVGPDGYADEMNGDSNEDIEKLLMYYIKGIPLQDKKKLLYLVAGDHGSSNRGILDMCTAYLSIPLYMRLPIAHNILDIYEISRVKKLTSTDHVQPNLEFLNMAIRKCQDALKTGKDRYSDASD